MKRVCVIGGGVTGLTLCRQLEKSVRDLAITLYEPEQMGGKVRTVRRDGFCIEEGADSFLLKSGSPLDLLLAELGLSEKLISPRERTFAIQRKGKLHTIPLGMLKGFPDNLISLWKCSLFSLSGKLSATLIPAWSYLFPKELKGDPSIAESLRARYGAEVSQYFFETVFGGIHSGDANALSFKSLYPDMADPKGPQGGKYARARFVSFPKGMDTFVSALANSFLYTDLVRESVLSVVRNEDESGDYLVRSESGERAFDAVVVATPAFVTTKLLSELDSALSEALSNIRHSSSAIATLVLSGDQISKAPKGSGYLMAPGEDGFVTGCTYSSQKWEGRAPGSELLVRIFFGRNGGVADVSDEEIRKAALAEVREKLGFDGEPRELLIKRWNSGLPQYECGHEERLKEIDESVQKHSGLFLTGTSYRGVGIPDCVKQAYATAEQVSDFLSGKEFGNFSDSITREEGRDYGETVRA